MKNEASAMGSVITDNLYVHLQWLTKLTGTRGKHADALERRGPHSFYDRVW